MDLNRKVKAVANRMRKMSDQDLFNLFLEAGAWRRRKLEELGQVELDANEDLEKERIEGEALKAEESKAKTKKQN